MSTSCTIHSGFLVLEEINGKMAKPGEIFVSNLEARPRDLLFIAVPAKLACDEIPESYTCLA